MRHARRFIATLIGIAFWCVAATTVAYAKLPVPDGGVVPPLAPTGPIDPERSGWQIVAIVALAALLTVAVVGLIASLRHSRSSRPSPMAHA